MLGLSSLGWPRSLMALVCFLATLHYQKDSNFESEVDLNLSDEFLRRFEKNERLNQEGYQRFLADPTPGAVFYYLANDTAFVEFAAGYELLRKKLQAGEERFRLGYLNIPQDYHPKVTRDMLLEDLPGLTVYHNCVPFTVSTELDPANLSFLPQYIAEIRSAQLEIITHSNREMLRRSSRDYKVIYFSRGGDYDSVMGTLQHRTKDYASIFVVQEESLLREFFQSKQIELSAVGNFLLACYRETDNQVIYFSQEITIFNIVRFVLGNRFPRWPVFDDRLWNWAQDHHVDLLLVFYHETELAKYQEKLEPMRSELLARRVVPVKAYLNSEYSRKFAEEAGLLRHLPGMLVFQPHVPGLPKYLYRPSNPNDKQATLEFIWKCSTQKHRPFYKSDLPTKRLLGPVGIAVGDDFDSKVLDVKKRHHSLLFFIDKEIQPIVSKFIEAILQIKPKLPNMKYFVFNCTSNEHPFVTSDFRRKIVLVPRGARRYGGHIHPVIMDPEASLTARSLLHFIFDNLVSLDKTIKAYFDNNFFD